MPLRLPTICLLAAAFVLLRGASSLAQDSTAEQQQFVFAYRLLQNGDAKTSAEAFDKYLDNFPKGEKRGDALYFRALLAWQAGKADQATKLLTDVPAMKVVPEHRLHFLRGRIDIEQNRFDTALKSLEPIKLDALEPAEKADLLYHRGLAYRGAKNFAAAADSFAAAGQIDSTVKDRCLLELGRALALTGKNDDAIKALQQCLALGNKGATAEAARLAGDLSYNAGQYEQALKFYSEVLTKHQTSPHFAGAVLQTLWATLYSKQYDAVITTFDQYKARLDLKDRATAWFLAGRANQELGKHKDAITLFEAVLSAKIGAEIEEQILFRMADSQFALGDYDAMARSLDRLSRDFPTSRFIASGDYLLSQTDLKRGKSSEAAARMTAIVGKGETHPYYAAALLDRAALYVAANQIEPAAKDYEAYLKLAAQPERKLPYIVETQAKMMDLYYRLNRFTDVAAVADKLLATPNIAPLIEQEALFRKALVHIQTDKLIDAANSFNQLTAKYPTTPFIGQVRYYRGLILMGENKLDDAAKELQSAVGDVNLPGELRANALLLVSIRQREKNEDDAAVATLAELEKVVTIDRMRDIDLLYLGRYHIQREPRSAFKYLYPLVDGKRKVPQQQTTESLYIIGQGLRAVGKHDLAIQSFKEVEALGQGYGLLARLEIARTQAEAGKLSDAFDTYRGLMISSESKIAATALLESAQIQRQLAANLKRAADEEGAAKANKEAHSLAHRLTVLYSFPELSPLPELAHIERAELAVLIGKPDDAASSLKELKERFASGPYAQYGSALQMIDAKQNNEAGTLLRKLRQQKLDARLAAKVAAKLRELEGTP